jgi:hypothetical protein
VQARRARRDQPIEDLAVHRVGRLLHGMAVDRATGGAGARQQRAQGREPERPCEIARLV